MEICSISKAMLLARDRNEWLDSSTNSRQMSGGEEISVLLRAKDQGGLLSGLCVHLFILLWGKNYYCKTSH